jgi:hypothetical protein
MAEGGQLSQRCALDALRSAWALLLWSLRFAIVAVSFLVGLSAHPADQEDGGADDCGDNNAVTHF